MPPEDTIEIAREIDRARASAEVCRAWASEVRLSPDMPSQDSLIRAAEAFEQAARELERR